MRAKPLTGLKSLPDWKPGTGVGRPKDNIPPEVKAGRKENDRILYSGSRSFFVLSNLEKTKKSKRRSKTNPTT